MCNVHRQQKKGLTDLLVTFPRGVLVQVALLASIERAIRQEQGQNGRQTSAMTAAALSTLPRRNQDAIIEDDKVMVRSEHYNSATPWGFSTSSAVLKSPLIGSSSSRSS